jgi:hypothetical protein
VVRGFRAFLSALGEFAIVLLLFAAVWFGFLLGHALGY